MLHWLKSPAGHCLRRCLEDIAQPDAKRVARQIVDNADRVERRAASHKQLKEVIEQVRVHKGFQQRPGNRSHSLVGLCPRNILEKVAKLVVYLELKHGRNLCKWIAALEKRRHGTL